MYSFEMGVKSLILTNVYAVQLSTKLKATKAWGRGQKSEVRSQRTEGKIRRQKSGDSKQRTEVREQENLFPSAKLP
jgi:hypothetical protein